jgi:D-threo-aldose 1-dehydrogenase
MSGQANKPLLEFHRLGRRECEVTRIGLGTAALGNLFAPVSEDTARKVVDAAWEAGIRFFDTAPYYGFGLSERRLGDALRPRCRGTFTLSTKAGRLLKPVPGHHGLGERHGFCSPMPFEPVYDYSYDGVMRAFEDSLQRLGVARIDVLLVHDIGELTHGKAHVAQLDTLRSSGFRALESLRAAGVLKAIGLGVNEWQACDEALEWGDFDCFLLAGRYTLLEQEPLQRLLPRCAAAGVSLIIGGVFNSGILAVGSGKAEGSYYDYQPAQSDVVVKVARIEAICQAWSVALPAAAIQFPLAHPQVASILCGARSAAELETFLELYSASIPQGFWSDLKASGLIDTDAPVPADNAEAPP